MKVQRLVRRLVKTLRAGYIRQRIAAAERDIETERAEFWLAKHTADYRAQMESVGRIDAFERFVQQQRVRLALIETE